MIEEYDSQRQCDAFDEYVKANPHGRQIHHTGTLGYDEEEWEAFQWGWNAALQSRCNCATCSPITLSNMRMILCPVCGNKRCPKASNHIHDCTNSNEPGQVGSRY